MPGCAGGAPRGLQSRPRSAPVDRYGKGQGGGRRVPDLQSSPDRDGSPARAGSPSRRRAACPSFRTNGPTAAQPARKDRAGALPPSRRRSGKGAGLLLALTLPIVAVFLITLLAAPRLGGGWFWDAGNALGFLAFAGLLVQMIPARGARGLPAHERLGYAVLAVAVAHAFWFLLGDGTVRVYLQPDAPLHMLLGLGGLLILAVLTILARMPDRLGLHADYRAFRRTHRMLGLLAAGGRTCPAEPVLPVDLAAGAAVRAARSRTVLLA